MLRQVDLQVERGEFVAIMGKSGAGKSTLLNILGCLDVPTSGTYFLDDQNVHKLTDDERSLIRGQKIGFVFQSFNLLTDCTVYENVELPFMYRAENARQVRERVSSAIEQVGLAHRSHYYANQISGGELQRAAIARAIATEPKVILADEPTGNLDGANTREILTLFQQLHTRSRTTIVMITHDEDVAACANKTITLADGLIIES